MEIKYIAHSSFIIKTKTATVVTDPFHADIGFKFPKTPADVVLISHHHDDHDNIKGIEGEPIVFDWPGEYDCKGIAIRGIASYHDNEKGAKRGKNVMFKITAENMSILHCGDLGHSLDDKIIEEIGNIDILCIPVGGHYTIDSHVAMQITKQIEPSIVLPMHYQTPDLNPKIAANLKPVTDFISAMSQSGLTPQPKLVVKREEIAQQTNTKIALLERNV
jgi:L-ascorbate metabolism protein UlaG (beta-lactamase superfamily)